MWDPDYVAYLVDIGAGDEYDAYGDEELELDYDSYSEEEQEEASGEDYDNAARMNAGGNRSRALGSEAANPTGTNTSVQEVVVNVESQDGDPVAVEGENEIGGTCRVAPENEDDGGLSFLKVDDSGQFRPDEIDGLVCPICLEPWSSSGEHHVCCLPCGHIYGLSCIKKWLKPQGPKKCPQCKKSCGIKDIRQLYASQIVAIDGELQKKVQSLEVKCASLEREMAGFIKKEAGWKKREAELQKQNKSLEERNRELENRLDGGTVGLDTSLDSCANGLPSKFLFQKDFHVAGARLFDIDASNQMLVVARRLPGYGGAHVLTKVSLLSDHGMEDVSLPFNFKAIKDVQVSPHAKLVLLASLGKKLSVLSTESNTTILTYDLPAAAWSCAWDVCSPHYVYTGLQNGMVLQFDMRQTVTCVESLAGLSPNPIHTLCPLSSSLKSESNIRSIFTASSDGLCQWNFGGSEGVCISVACSKSSNHIVASYRAKIESSQSTLTPPGLPARGIHVLYSKNGCTYERLRQTCSSVNAIRLPKSDIVDGVYPYPVFASVDEFACLLTFQQLPSLSLVDCLQIQCPVLDMKYKRLSSVGMLGCSCNDAIKLFTAT